MLEVNQALDPYEEPTWFPAASSHLIKREILALPAAVVRWAAAATARCGVGDVVSVPGLA